MVVEPTSKPLQGKCIQSGTPKVILETCQNPINQKIEGAEHFNLQYEIVDGEKKAKIDAKLTQNRCKNIWNHV